MTVLRSLPKYLFVFVLCLFGLVLVEGGARLLWGPFSPKGVLLFSENPFQGGEDGQAVRFLSNRTIRALSTFGERREFDVRFRTNNMGLIDGEDYPLAPKPRNIAVVGDSYSAGYHGGEPRIPGLRKLVDNANVYNLGVTGTGFVQFADLLNAVTSRVPIDEVVIVAISSDVGRKPWSPVVHGGRLYLCALDTPRENCLSRKSAILIHDDEKAGKTTETRIEDYYDSLPAVGLRRYLSRHTYVGSLFRSRTWKRRSKPLNEVTVPGFTVEAVQKIRALFKERPVTLLHIPEKREVAVGHFYTDLKGLARDAGVEFVDGLARCGLTEADYFPRDPHPNAAGYGKIRRCVANILTDK